MRDVFLAGIAAPHALHLLSIVAMDEPAPSALHNDPGCVVREKVNLLRALRPASPSSFVLGCVGDPETATTSSSKSSSSDVSSTVDGKEPLKAPSFFACCTYVETRRWQVSLTLKYWDKFNFLFTGPASPSSSWSASTWTLTSRRSGSP